MPTFTEKEIKTLSDIIRAAYTDILSSETWLEIFGLTAQVVPLEAASTKFFDPETGKPGNCTSQNTDPRFYRQYQEYYHTKDLATQRARASNILVWRPTDVVRKSVWENSEIYTDLLAPHRFYHAVSVMLGSGSEMPAQFWLVRTTPGSGFTDEDVRFLELLQPHLANALRKARALEELSRAKAALQAGLDQFDRPIFLFDDDARLIYMNQSARAICEPPNTPPGDRLAIIQASAAVLIKKKIEASNDLELPSGVKCILGDTTYMLEGSPIYPPGSSRQWTVVAVDLTHHIGAALRMAMDARELSSREVEICAMLVGGLSNREIADKLFISEFTVKDHIKNIFEKLKISSRSEVAARLLGL